MFSGFNLTTENSFSDFETHGNKIFNDCKDKVIRDLEQFIVSTGGLDGTKMQSSWFPQINADVFISHSHKDRKKAIGLAGWLNAKFGLNVFIDSCVWGYADELLRIIDNEYCLNDDKTFYNYEKRNFSTSHIHMMLSTALTMMMDKIECIFFLNTPNSICPSDIIDKTESPWIYYELAMTKLVNKRALSEYRQGILHKALFETAQNQKELEIKYNVSLDHLCYITQSDLDSWSAKFPIEVYPLDTLYKSKRLIEQ